MSLKKYIHQVKPREESYVNHVDRIQDLLTEASRPGNATIFEEYIVDAWNQLLDNGRPKEVFLNTKFSSVAHQK